MDYLVVVVVVVVVIVVVLLIKWIIFFFFFFNIFMIVFKVKSFDHIIGNTKRCVFAQ
jgi:hypothetical protein